MENINDNLDPQLKRLHILMTSNESVHENDFFETISSSKGRYDLAKTLTSDLDFFVKIAIDRIGSSRVKIILVSSDEDVKSMIFFQIINRFPNIVTHERGYGLGLLILNFCNSIYHKNIICHTTCRYALVLVRNEYGCIIVKKVISRFKHEFLDRIAHHAFLLSKKDLGISLIKHVLNLDFTRKTTQDDHTRSHELMAEFDEILSTTSDTTELRKCALKLTSDSDLCIDFIKTRRGSLMAQIILGRSEEIDMLFFEAIKQRFTDFTNDLLSYGIVLHVMDVFKKRGNVKVCDQILRLIGVHALRLTKDPCVGYKVVLDAIGLNDFDSTNLIAHNLDNHYIELSFMRNVSEVVEKLVENSRTVFPLGFLVKEIVKSDEDTLVRLAKDEYGNKVLKKIFEVAKERRYKVLLGDLADKLKPILDKLLWSRGVNIAPIMDLRHHIASLENN